MKRIFSLAIALVALLILIGCESNPTLTAPDVTPTVADTGATLHLAWVEIDGADGYYIYADGVAIDTIDDPATTTYDATVPAMVYEVSAYAGEDESDKTQIDCEAEVTLTLEVWDTDDVDPLHPSGFGFNTAGTAIAYALADTANKANIDYYIHGGATQQFWSPHHHGNLNDQVNVTVNSGTTDFDAATIADAPGGYTSQTNVVDGAVYYFWIDPTNNLWDNVTDYFGKIKVEAISGDKVTMKLAFQKIAGLRWCVTP